MSTDYGRVKCKDAVWEKGLKIPGKNPNTHRADAYGNELYKYSYGKRSSKGWEIDHIIPQSKGGIDKLPNLQPLKAKTNASLQNKIVGKRFVSKGKVCTFINS